MLPPVEMAKIGGVRDGRMGREEGWRESDADEKVQWSPNVVAGNYFVQQLFLDCVYLSEWAVGYYINVWVRAGTEQRGKPCAACLIAARDSQNH